MVSQSDCLTLQSDNIPLIFGEQSQVSVCSLRRHWPTLYTPC